jgi:hypothetical protein
MLQNNHQIIQRIRNSRTFRGTAALLLLSIIFEIAQPTVSLALTEGPSQPEVQSFEPINTTEMVDLFTGDFNYNIPLFNLPGPNGGYPFNIAYHAGVSMDDEASWTGLGWNINAGSLVRNMRGLPDEFKSTTNSDGEWLGGDYVETKTDMKSSWSLGLTYGQGFEVAGGELLGNASVSASLYFNNYRGLGVGVNAGMTSENSRYSLGLSLDAENGLGVNAGVRLNSSEENNRQMLSASFDGNLSASYSLSVKRFEGRDDKLINPNSSMTASSISFARSNYSPSVGMKVNKYNLSFNLSFGESGFFVYSEKKYGGFFNTEDYNDEEKRGKKRPVVGYAAEGSVNRPEYYTKDFVRMRDGLITRQTPVLPHSSYTYDSYTSTGQGMSGYFRGRRNDVGRVFDPKLKNTSWGASVNVEIKKITTGVTLSVPNPADLTQFFTIPVPTGTSNHLGIGGTGSFGWDLQGPWGSDAEENDLNELSYDFKNPTPAGIKENHYYMVHGEPTILDNNEYQHINGLDLALVKLTPRDGDDLGGGKRKIKASDNTHLASERNVAPGKRAVRNTLVHNLKNSEVANLGEFKLKYYTFDANLSSNLKTQSGLTNFSRSVRGNNQNIGDHYAGFKVLNDQGSYYVYGLPAYNTKEVQSTFSVDAGNFTSGPEDQITIQTEGNDVKYKHGGTHKYINKTTKSPYAHSYLLSSILGADYVDVQNDGPTNDDLGYWVKFDYVKYSDSYKWRAPYLSNKASYSRGDAFTQADDKGTYQYGEKEIWYLGRAETKTHVAIFRTSERSDSKEAAAELPGGVNSARKGLKLDAIEIYRKDSNGAITGDPVQVINFKYKYQLCKGSLNSTSVASATTGDENQAKLTLSEISFTGMGSHRKRNRYSFDYTTVSVPADLAATISQQEMNGLANPDYALNRTDPWGTYRPSDQNYLQRTTFPYTRQFNQGWDSDMDQYYQGSDESDYNKKVTQTTQDMFASAWCLRKITLPSGGNIVIDYESDDYGYVQHKTAAQMFRITKMGHMGGAGYADNEIYRPGPTVDGGDDGFDYEANETSRRIYFKLEEPIPVSSTGLPEKIYNDYVEPLVQDEHGDRNVFIKTKMQLTDGIASQVQDYVSGYLPIEHYSSEMFGVAPNTASIDVRGDNSSAAVSCYTHGFITVQIGHKKDGGDFSNFHPVALMGWNYMQTQAQQLLNNPNSFDSENEGSLTIENGLGKIVDLLNFVPAAANSFGFIRKYCHGKGFAGKIDLNESCIRLASPDKKKFGGGHRVKKISITDGWSSSTGSLETDRTYGQVYEYTIREGDREISSGVAQYEPQAGGDENALKYPVYFYGKTSVFTSNNLFAEAPFNEDLFPGAAVGYRKVTVKSINTDRRLKNSTSIGGRTGGVTVNEFYTAKEFPTLVEQSILAEENNTKDVFNLTVPIPLIGSIKRNYYHGTQAFKIELNDMHGRPRSVKTYELFTINAYKLNPEPITSTEFEYQTKLISYQGEEVMQLDNLVNIVPNNNTHTMNANDKRMMGVEAELFTDQRESKTFYNTAGLDFNLDLMFFGLPIPVPTFWPNYSNHKTMMRTFVTNKVVHKTGILKRTKTKDLQTISDSEIVAYDEKSGMPLLTKIRNEFGDNFYQYNVPAYYAYDGMGHAYRNINYNFQTDLEPRVDEADLMEFTATPENLDYLVRGDELLITGSTANSYKMQKVYFLGWRYTSTGVKGLISHPFFTATDNIEASSLKVIRSGRRNLFGSSAASYLSKGRPQDLFTTADHVLLNQGLSSVTTKKFGSNVLSATASLYRDNWTTGTAASEAITPGNPYIVGNSGIWRPFKTYTYAGERSTSASFNDNTTTDPKLYNDGVMSNVPMFSWELGQMERYVSNWEWVNEVTRYSPDAYELENRNRLGIYSSALYGYDNSLSIGVASNAATFESGVADFETVGMGTSLFLKVLQETNLNFDNNHAAGDVFLNEQWDIGYATTIGQSSVIEVMLNMPFERFEALQNAGLIEDRLSVSLTSAKSNATVPGNTGYYFNAALVEATTRTGLETMLKLQPYFVNILQHRLLPSGGDYYGVISFPYQRSYSAVNGTAGVSYVAGKSHSGKRSMKLDNPIVFEQPKLKFKSGTSYVASLWVSRNGTDVVTFKPSSGSLFEVGTVSNGTFTPSAGTIVTYGKIIEGWQKIDIEFNVTDGFALHALRFTPGGYSLFVDDFRVSPKTGGIATYVYDNILFRLMASLNADNYATFHYYDEEGNLHLKKQETEEGIFTVTESRGYVKNSGN